jgi:tetratricopeptide (TPR) repeat protein
VSFRTTIDTTRCSKPSPQSPSGKRDAEIQAWLGTAAWLTDHIEDARRFYDAALESDPGLRGARLGRIFLDEEMERPYAVLSDLDFYLRSHPDDTTFLARRAEILLEIGRPRDAAADLTHVLHASDAADRPELSDLGRWFLRAGEHDKAITCYEEDFTATLDGFTQSNLGEALLWANQVNRAAELLDRALASAHDSWVTFLRGLTEKVQGDYGRAVVTIRTAIAEIDRRSDDGGNLAPREAFNRALYLLVLDDAPLALEAYRETVANASLKQLREAAEDGTRSVHHRRSTPDATGLHWIASSGCAKFVIVAAQWPSVPHIYCAALCRGVRLFETFFTQPSYVFRRCTAEETAVLAAELRHA